MRKPKAPEVNACAQTSRSNGGHTTSKKKAAPVQIHFAPKDEVFTTINLKKRTSKFYNEFAKQTIEMDVAKDNK